MKQSKITVIFAAFFLATGASLLVYIFSGFSLLLAIGISFLLSAIAGSVSWRKLEQAKRTELKRRVKVGIISGIVATAVYDGSRFLLIKITGIQFWPFDIFNVFGQALFGPEVHGLWVTIAGIIFHFTNGITFAVSYTILFGTYGVFAGIIWALFLETLMVFAYPRWLNIKLINEFLSVSIFGHIMYGSTLGHLAKKLLLRHNNQEKTK